MDYLTSRRAAPHLEGTNRFLWRIGTERIRRDTPIVPEADWFVDTRGFRRSQAQLDLDASRGYIRYRTQVTRRKLRAKWRAMKREQWALKRDERVADRARKAQAKRDATSAKRRQDLSARLPHERNHKERQLIEACLLHTPCEQCGTVAPTPVETTWNSKWSGNWEEHHLIRYRLSCGCRYEAQPNIELALLSEAP